MNVYVVARKDVESHGVVRAGSLEEAIDLAADALSVDQDELHGREIPLVDEPAGVIGWAKTHPDEIADHHAAVLRRAFGPVFP